MTYTSDTQTAYALRKAGGDPGTAEYLLFMLLYPLALMPVNIQTILLIALAAVLIIKKKPKLDRFFILMMIWCVLYLASILINLGRKEHVKGNVISAFFTLGLYVAALLFYIHYRNTNLNLTRVGKYAFRNLLILDVLAFIFILFPSSARWSIFGRQMAEIDILHGDVYGYRFCGFLDSTYIVIFFLFFNFPLSVYYIEKRFRKRWQILYAVLLFAPVRAAGSRIGLLLYIALFIFFLFVEFRDFIKDFYKEHKGIAIAVFTAIAIVLVIAGVRFIGALILSRPTSNSGRMVHYGETVRTVLQKSPLIGLGINEKIRPSAADLLGEHSTYLNVLYRTGIIGAALYFAALTIRLYDLFKDKVISKQRIVYIAAILETLLLMIVEDVDRMPWTICFFYIMVAIFDRISQPVETLAIKPSLNIAMLGQKHIQYREGGVEVVVAELSTRMVKLGHHVTCYDRGGHHVSGKDYDESGDVKKEADHAAGGASAGAMAPADSSEEGAEGAGGAGAARGGAQGGEALKSGIQKSEVKIQKDTEPEVPVKIGRGRTIYKGVVVKQVFTINKKGLAAFSSAFFAAIEASFSSADVIHFHAEGPCVMMWLPKLFGKCCVCTIHGIDWQRAKWKGTAKKVIHYGEKVAAREADAIIVLSGSAQDYFWKTYQRKTILIPNGIEKAVPAPVDRIRSLYGLEKEQYILFLGRIVPEKGIHYLINAFRAIPTDKKLVIAGGSSDTVSYFEKMKELAAGDERIIFTGFISGRPMEELYSNAYLYVLPSDLEGMPLTILEAMSYGLCCVVSDIPECADVVQDAGVTFRHGDTADLQRTLEKMLASPDLVKDYGRRAKKHVLSHYSWDDVTERTIAVYRGTLDTVSEAEAISRMEK